MKPLPATLLLALLAGCATPENDRMTIGPSTTLEVLNPTAAPADDQAAEQVATPSITGMSRAHWQMTPVLVPVDGTYARQTYAKRASGTDSTRRQRRQFPTAVSALELTNGSEEDQEGEAALNALLAISDVILIIPRAIIDWPYKTRISPDEAYSRYWHPERWEVQPEDADLPPPGPATLQEPRRVTP